jgi:hypothetical protein
VYYCIAAQGVSEWEVGIGTFTAPSTLSRDTIYSSSAAGALVTFTAGTKDVFITYPSERAVFEEADGTTVLRQGPITVVGSNASAYTSFGASLGEFYANTPNFAQLYVQNLNGAANASTDIVAYNNLGDGTNKFIDMGICSSAYTDAAFPIFSPNSGYVYNDGGTLLLGSATNNVTIFSGGVNVNSAVVTFDTNKSASFTGNVSVVGNVTSNGNAVIGGTIVIEGGAFSNAANITASNQLTTKAYVDNATAAGLHIHEPVNVATTTNLVAVYNNGSNGVGATLTNNATQATVIIDNITLSANNRVLVWQQSNAVQNGVYVVTNTGSNATNWVLTRSDDADTSSQNDPNSLGGGDYFYVLSGDTQAGDSFVCTSEGNITFGTTLITFSLFSATPTFTGTAPINVSGQTISLTGIVGATNGGTGANTVATGDLLYGSATNTWSKLPIGSGYKSLVVNAGGTQVEWNAVPLDQSAAISGSLGPTNGGTGISSYTTGDTLYSSAANTLAKLAGNTTTTKKFLGQTGNGSGSAAPVWEQPAASDITGLAPSATTDTSNASNITSGTLPTGRLTGQYTGITGVGVLSNGTWTANTIAVAYGGTGAINATDARTNLGLVIGANVQAYSLQVQSLADISTNGILARSAANTVTPRTITQGSTITVTNGDGSAGNPTIAFSVAPGTADNVLVSNGSAWTSSVAPPGRASGGAIWVNDTTVTSNVSIGTGQNGFTVGPMATANGVSVTIASGQRLVII